MTDVKSRKDKLVKNPIGNPAQSLKGSDHYILSYALGRVV